jgi:hypothetical protein
MQRGGRDGGYQLGNLVQSKSRSGLLIQVRFWQAKSKGKEKGNQYSDLMVVLGRIQDVYLCKIVTETETPAMHTRTNQCKV